MATHLGHASAAPRPRLAAPRPRLGCAPQPRWRHGGSSGSGGETAWRGRRRGARQASGVPERDAPGVNEPYRDGRGRRVVRVGDQVLGHPHSKPRPGHFKDTSKTLQRHSRDTPETLPRHSPKPQPKPRRRCGCGGRTRRRGVAAPAPAPPPSAESSATLSTRAAARRARSFATPTALSEPRCGKADPYLPISPPYLEAQMRKADPEQLSRGHAFGCIQLHSPHSQPVVSRALSALTPALPLHCPASGVFTMSSLCRSTRPSLPASGSATTWSGAACAARSGTQTTLAPLRRANWRLQPCARRPRSLEITRDHSRSPEITRDHPRSPETTRPAFSRHSAPALRAPGL